MSEMIGAVGLGFGEEWNPRGLWGSGGKFTRAKMASMERPTSGGGGA